MKKNLYFQLSLNRQKLNTAALNQVINLSFLPRLLLEVFIRKNFGQRYFSIGATNFILVVLALIPLIRPYLATRFHYFDWGNFFTYYGTWYAFLGAFFWFARKRDKEIEQSPNTYDFKKYSLYAGDVDPRLLTFAKGNSRTLETFIEPTLFLVPGIVLLLLSQPLGYVIIASSLLYSASYRASYRIGDDFVLNMIDEMICNEELQDVFVEDKQPEDARGIRFMGRKPAGSEKRRHLVEHFSEQDDAVQVL